MPYYVQCNITSLYSQDSMANRVTARVGQYIDIHDNENCNN